MESSITERGEPGEDLQCRYSGQEHWYALYTRPCWEKRVAHSLSSQSLKVYLPMQRCWARRSLEKREIEVPLFPGYLFVWCHLSKENWLTIKKTMGVVRILGVDGQPSPIPDHEIEWLQKFLAVDPWAQRYSALHEGCPVRVVKGPLKGLTGTLVRTSRNRSRLVITVDQIGWAASAEIRADWVERYDP